MESYLAISLKHLGPYVKTVEVRMSNLMIEAWEEFRNGELELPEFDEITVDNCEECFYAGWNKSEANDEQVGKFDYLRDQHEEIKNLKDQLKDANKMIDKIRNHAVTIEGKRSSTAWKIFDAIKEYQKKWGEG